ncbi:MAG: hypothetical protein PHG25_03390 [Candidatus Pacebacteria bacterium]|nr:hypothetical protein [Candidatus Paceibacterota bacterium]
MALKLGGAIVDIGNVIIAYRLSGLNRENYHSYDFDSIPPEPGCFDTLKQLNEEFGGNITVVWKATDDAVGKNMQWLQTHQFTELTGIPVNRIRRIGAHRAEKVDFIDQTSQTHGGTTIVIDDRLEVLSHFVGKVPNLFLFRPQQPEVEQFSGTGALSHVHVVQSWQEIREILAMK